MRLSPSVLANCLLIFGCGPRAGVAGRGTPHCGRCPEQHLLDRGRDAAGTGRDLIRDWRWLLLAVTLPCVPGILSLW